jgi:ATP-dependent DNA helicase RecG
VFIRELKEPIESLKGVGKQIAASYKNLGVFSLSDLLLLKARTYEDRLNLVPLGLVKEGEAVNTKVEVVGHSYFGAMGKRTLKVTVKDISGEGDGKASLLCFGRNFLERTFKIGYRFYLYGHFQRNFHELQSSQFEMVPLKIDGSMPSNFGQLLPIYPLSGILSQRIIRRDVENILLKYPQFDEELPLSFFEKYSLLPINEALKALHRPTSYQQVKEAHHTFAFIELFYLFLISRRKSSHKRSAQKSFSYTPLQKRFIELLPFSLTEDQQKAVKDICLDLQDDYSMNRLLQGDVGSGKTLVAWLSSLQVIEQNYQVAFMAPTELLARQHAEQAAIYLEPLGIRIAFLTGSVPQSRRKHLLEALKEGQIDIIVGTHALFSSEVTFKNLKYIIIDEQHRFGVAQRLALLNKGDESDVLMMSATPIPRTLALTVFGDLNISTLKVMPKGRLPIITYLVSDESRERMYKSIEVEFNRGHQAYFVYPRIESEKESSLRDVESMFKFLSEEMYPNIPSALIHSRLSEEQKFSILHRFKTKELTYLVSTSVVEVGIDIPDATCMVVEHAERFGLAALHQLRGRVGRRALQSYCFLVYQNQLNEDAKKRLLVMKESNDGFFIAEQDLLIRGPGEVAGIKQSGFLKLRFASLTEESSLIEQISKIVDSILREDRGLITVENATIRSVLNRAPLFDDELLES